eukprot:1158214-Pelagomonas_calceolata.AAC.2
MFRNSAVSALRLGAIAFRRVDPTKVPNAMCRAYTQQNTGNSSSSAGKWAWTAGILGAGLLSSNHAFAAGPSTKERSFIASKLLKHIRGLVLHSLPPIAVKPDGVHRGMISNIISRFEQKGYKLILLTNGKNGCTLDIRTGCPACKQSDAQHIKRAHNSTLVSVVFLVPLLWSLLECKQVKTPGDNEAGRDCDAALVMILLCLLLAEPLHGLSRQLRSVQQSRLSTHACNSEVLNLCAGTWYQDVDYVQWFHWHCYIMGVGPFYAKSQFGPMSEQTSRFDVKFGIRNIDDRQGVLRILNVGTTPPRKGLQGKRSWVRPRRLRTIFCDSRPEHLSRRLRTIFRDSRPEHLSSKDSLKEILRATLSQMICQNLGIGETAPMLANAEHLESFRSPETDLPLLDTPSQRSSPRLEEPRPMWLGPSWEVLIRNQLLPGGSIWPEILLTASIWFSCIYPAFH